MNTVDVWIFVEMIDATGIERGSTTDDAMHLIIFCEQKLGKVTAVLSGDTCDQSFLHHLDVFVLYYSSAIQRQIFYTRSRGLTVDEAPRHPITLSLTSRATV